MAFSISILGRLLAAIDLLAMETGMNSKYVYNVWAKLVLQSLYYNLLLPFNLSDRMASWLASETSYYNITCSSPLTPFFLTTFNAESFTSTSSLEGGIFEVYFGAWGEVFWRSGWSWYWLILCLKYGYFMPYWALKVTLQILVQIYWRNV